MTRPRALAIGSIDVEQAVALITNAYQTGASRASGELRMFGMLIEDIQSWRDRNDIDVTSHNGDSHHVAGILRGGLDVSLRPDDVVIEPGQKPGWPRMLEELLFSGESTIVHVPLGDGDYARTNVRIIGLERNCPVDGPMTITARLMIDGEPEIVHDSHTVVTDAESLSHVVESRARRRPVKRRADTPPAPVLDRNPGVRRAIALDGIPEE